MNAKQRRKQARRDVLRRMQHWMGKPLTAHMKRLALDSLKARWGYSFMAPQPLPVAADPWPDYELRFTYRHPSSIAAPSLLQAI